MTFTNKLDHLMAENGLNRREFSVQSGIPYMTIVNFYEKGSDNVKLSTLKKIAAYFNVSLDYIADDLVTEKGSATPCHVSFSSNEIDLIVAYRRASDDDRAVVDAAMRKYRGCVPNLSLVAARDGGLSAVDTDALEKLAEQMEEEDSNL